MRNRFAFAAAILITSFLSAQSLDTIKIHRPFLFGIHYHKCYKIWFGTDNNFSYSVITKQDKILANDSSYYFKVYGYSKKIILEGKKFRGGELCGEIKFYYKNGQLKETRYYRDYIEGYTAKVSPIICDGGSPWGTWKYYNRKGRVRKTIVFSSEKDPTNKEIALKIISVFNRKGKIRSIKKVERHPCSF